MIINYAFQNTMSIQYQLVGVCYHEGETTEEGHYLSHIQDGQQWLKVDDCKVNNFIDGF